MKKKSDQTVVSDTSPYVSIQNVARYAQIIEAIRKAGIPEKDIEFLMEFNQVDLLHISHLLKTHHAQESEKQSKVLASN